GVDTMLDVVGVGWPNVDEDAYRDMADALREFASDADDDAGTAHGHIQRLLSTGQSESLTALDKHWKKVQGKNKDLAGAARIIAGALDRVADIIVARKIAAVAELADLCATVGIALAAAPFTMGLTTLLAGGKIVATRIAFKKILKEMAEAAVAEITATLTQPAVAALESIVTDLAIQTAMDVTGAGDGSTQINSAGGSGGSGPGGTLGIDHDAHGNTGGKLANVQVSMNGRAKGKIDKAKGHHGRAKGKDSLTAVLDGTIEGVVEKLIKGHNHLGDHVGKKLPDALGQSSKTHKNTDKDVDDRIKKITGSGKRDSDDLTGKRTNPSDPARKHPDDVRTKPASLDGVKNDTERNAAPLGSKQCKGDPVDVATGEMTLPQIDLSLPGVLPLVLRRTHLSEYRYGHWFGRSWAATLDERIELDARGQGVFWAREDGSVLAYPRLPAPGDDVVFPLVGPRMPLRHGGQDEDVTLYEVADPRTGLTRSFAGSPYRASKAYWLNEIEDRNGNSIAIHRRPDGAPTGVVHSGGYQVRLTADDSRVTALAVRSPAGSVNLLAYGFDASGDLVSLTGPDGHAMRFTYDPDGRVTSWTDRNDTTFQYVYDSAGRVVRTSGPDGALSAAFAYEADPDSGHRVCRYTDSTGATTVLRVNERLQVVAETDPLGRTTVQSWSSDGHLLSRTDPLGHTTELTWDEDGNLTAVRQPDGTTTTARYNHFNLPVEVTTTEGARWRQSFDDLGNCTSFEAPDGTITRFTHDRTGAVATVTDAVGATTTVRGDAAGLPIEITNPASGTARVVRDHLGRPTRITDALGHSEHLSWDADDRLVSRVLQDGSEEQWTWDAEGNCLTYTNAAGAVATNTYGHFDKPRTRTGPDGSRHALRYDTELRLVQATDPLGRTWDYTYDPAGQLVAETDFDGRTTRYAYDAAGRLASRTTPLGQSVAYASDAMGRLTRLECDGAVTRYAYDAAGRLVSAASADSTLTRQWDVMGQLVAETVDGRTVHYAYDATGRRISRTTPTGAVSTLEYDLSGNLAAVSTGGHPLRFTRDVLGQELTRSWGAPAAPVTLTFAHDERRRPVRESLAGGPGPVRERTYAYRADDYPVTLAESAAGVHRDKHVLLDPVGRPLAVEAPDWVESYAYDGAGNQTAADWPAAAGYADARGPRTYADGQLVAAGSVRYTHDAAGRVVERRRHRPSRKPEVWRYGYDAHDRMVSCTTPDGTQWRYAYDPLGRRTAKHRMSADGLTTVETVLFTWDGTRVAEQSDSATGSVLTWEYDGHRPLSQYERKPSAPGGSLGQDAYDARFFAVVSDLVGTPTELLSEDGDTAWQARSTCWGSTAWTSAATAYTPLRFPGQYADLETGLHYNHFRHYDPHTGRYTSPDPLGLAPAPNPLTYVPNPWVWSDPLGLAPKRCQMDAYSWDGSVRFGRLDHLGRPTGVHAQLRREMLDTGTEAGSLKPPGWRGNGTLFNEARGHLLAARLGGPGKGQVAYHNLVTQTQDPTNSPHQRDLVEDVIYRAVDAGEIVQYSIKPVYAGTNPIPIRIEFEAFGNKGFHFSHSLDNPAAGVRTAIP
ncbi:DUF6531 domain-containing protein, partial [Streptomyces sp. NPDC003860]